MGITIRIFYKNIKVVGLENLPTNKPVIVASNHPNAFMDAMILSIIAKQKISYLARSDAFNTSFKKKLLGAIGLIPIYRIQEGADQLHKNEETFQICYKLLGNNATILMFPEGICIWEKRLRKLKKGLARMAFGAEETYNNKLGLLIVPMGINYSHAKNFRSDVYLQFGKAIEVDDFIKDYHKDKNKTIVEFTKYLEAKMAENVIIIDKRENDEIVENISTVYKKELMLSKGMDPKNLQHDFKVMNDINKAVSFFEHVNSSFLQSFKNKIQQYINTLNALNLRDHLLKKESIEKLSVWSYFKDLIFLFFGFPLHAYGLFNNYIPYRLAYNLTNKIVRNVEFHSSLNIAFGTFLSLFWYIILTVIFSFLFSWKILLIYILSLPLSGIFSIYYWTNYKKIMGKFRLLGLVKKEKEKIAELIHTRQEIVSTLEQARVEYKAQLAIKNN